VPPSHYGQKKTRSDVRRRRIVRWYRKKENWKFPEQMFGENEEARLNEIKEAECMVGWEPSSDSDEGEVKSDCPDDPEFKMMKIHFEIS
jgi:hypothetical protein